MRISNSRSEYIGSLRARTVTRSSGIGLLSLKLWLKRMRSAIRFSRSLLTSACLFWLSLCFSFVTKSRNASVAAGFPPSVV